MALNGFKILIVTLMMLLCYLQYRLWFDDKGMLNLWQMKKQIAVELAENAKLKKRNEILTSQVLYLQKNKESVETRARHEFGMIKKGETFYQVVNEPKEYANENFN